MLINDARPLWITPDYAYATANVANLPRILKVNGRNLQPTPQGTVQVRGTAFRRGPGWKVKFKDFTPQALAANAQQLAASPYQEFPNGRTGQWMVDSAHAPSGGRTRWTRLGSRPKR